VTHKPQHQNQLVLPFFRVT